MKRYALLLSAALGMAAAQTTKPVSPSSIPATPGASGVTTAARLADAGLTSANVSFDLRRSGSDLSSMLVALAKSAGYDIILEPDVDALLQGGSTASPGAAGSGTAGTRVTYNFVNRPFNEVWPLVLDIYGLSYETLRLGDKPVLRVSAKPIQKIVTLPRALSAALVERQLKLSFGSVKGSAQGTANTAQGATASPAEDIALDSPTMRIVAEPSSNSVIIRGTNQEVAQVERLLSQIVAAQPPALQAPAPVTPPQDVQRIYTVKGTQADVTSLLAAQYPALKVTPVGQTGRVVLTGPQAQIDAAMGLLGQVDLPAPATPTAPPVATGRSIYTVKGQQADISALLGAQYPELKVTPVGQTGQLILTGPQPQLDAALSLLGQVDRPAPSPQATVQRVFQLVNASAEEVKATLEGTLARDLTPATPPLANVPVNATDANGNAVTVTVPTNQTSAAGANADAQAKQAAGAAAQAAQNTGGATIIADKRTNSLIVRGTAQQVGQIADLIPQLDQVVPQINVQVRIQEITETAARSLGVDWKVAVGGFNIKMGSGGLGAAFDPTQSLVGFNIFPTLTALENQGLTKRVYDGNITMQSGQRSLGTGTSAQNASANAAASIKSGGRLEINIPSSSGNIIRQIDYGLNLDFFDPQVAPDGTVTLRVRGQVNNIAGALPTTSVPNLLNFTNSEAQSSITFKSGQTVLMSGLLGTSESRTNDGVPFLSSLPIIGAAFGKQSTTRTQTQLLVIITGSVVK
ncbi:type IV pilus assembly protein PilQ [Deinococcus aerius]|uniref:Type IV pilus assembly protein PilQ n=1 Tax=Deinococcus aerius TaxID=200253 RepID=A0A2I9CTM2_9DEIO|nr:secretin N-terminal domain-containing protein [Deinococcus aerius]GBF05133.1 type IV pilus assembly protein PilQ [Deinococcus aerius]